MSEIEFTPEEIDTREYERYHHPDPDVQKKTEVLCLKRQNVEHQEICRLCRISRPTLVAHLKQYQESGTEQLKAFGHMGQSSRLDELATTQETYSQRASAARGIPEMAEDSAFVDILHWFFYRHMQAPERGFSLCGYI